MFNKIFIKIRVREKDKTWKGYIVFDNPPSYTKETALQTFFAWCDKHYPGNRKHYTHGVMGHPYAWKDETVIYYKGYETLYYVMQDYTLSLPAEAVTV